jgi:pimeloyl-ACP methyl ester carboxylesterase
MPTVTVNNGAVDLVYEQSGAGRDVVWIAGGGDNGAAWRRWQTPSFDDAFRNTTFANRGVGGTVCRAEPPWTIPDLAVDAAALIEAVCQPPVAVVGLSMGALTVLQLAIDRPDLLRVGVAMGCAARGWEGWLGDYMGAEVELRRQGGRLEGRFSTIHYASMLYPAEVLGDPEMWAVAQELLGEDFESDNEASLIGQWQACIDFDVVDDLPGCDVPLHIFAFEQDVQAPPQYGRKVAELAPNAELYFFRGMGHCSIFGHRHETLNAEIRQILEAR